MDGNRFDTLVRSIGTWTSRRRLLGGMAGAAGAGLIARGGARAQEDQQPDPDVVAFIAAEAEAANAGLVSFRDAVEAYRRDQEGQGNRGFDPLAFDPRLGQFIDDLILLTEDARTNAGSWNSDQVQRFLLTINLVVGAISAGGDTDAYLHQFAISQIGGEATPVAEQCITPHRPRTCTATCLKVWEVRQTTALSSSDMVALVEAFFNFLECYLYFGSAHVPSGCLAGLIDPGCLAEIICGCAGDCH